MTLMSSRALFAPRTVAVIGASGQPGKVGRLVLDNLLQAGYEGKIFPVNPKYQEILGLPCIPTVSELPDDLDLAVICVPPDAVLEAVKTLAAKRLRAAVVITAGFRESGLEGLRLERELAVICRESNIMMVGPNCLGLIDTSSKLNVSFAADTPHAGNIGFFSQSGALCIAILDWAVGQGIGFSSFVSLGNKALTSEADMLAHMRNDERTKVILGYMEGVEDGRAFLAEAAKAAAAKPVIMMKSGTTAAGAKAASSHTGAISGADAAYQAAFTQAGVIRVRDVETLFHYAEAFSTQNLPEGPNLGIVTNSGGPAILAADAAEVAGLFLPRLTNETVSILKETLPPFAALYNPVDIIGDAPATRYRQALEAVIADPTIHAVLVILTPTPMAEPLATAQLVVEAAKHTNKPMFCCFMGDVKIAQAKTCLREAGIPCYPFPEPAIFSIAAMHRYAQWKKRPIDNPMRIKSDRTAAAVCIERVLVKKRYEIVEFEAQELLAAYGLPTPVSKLARSSDEAVAAAAAIGYPVVLKIASPQISHKSDIGGVVTNLKNEAEIRQAFFDITTRAARLKDVYIMGVLVQQMAPKGSKEIIVGLSRDPQFGPLILFGLGGIYVEVLKDVSFRVAPVTPREAAEMIREIRSYPLLRGVRGEAAVDFKAIESVILALSALATDFPELVEADLNPVLVSSEGALVADARFSLCNKEIC